ncbi:MAG: hypothetical protein NT139_01495 [Candidatus Woesearchaeota archaeon]|nr:hypothetical protein [Candidatus Woesearchaeota archaeon]
MRFKIRNRLEFLVTHCPLKKIDDKTYEKISTEICYRKCEYAREYITDADMLIGFEIKKKNLTFVPWRRMCVLKEQKKWPESIFDVYKR